MDDRSQFFYHSDLLYGVEPNDENDCMGYNNDENVGEDNDVQVQLSYPDFFIFLCLLLNNFSNSFRFFKSAMIF